MPSYDIFFFSAFFFLFGVVCASLGLQSFILVIIFVIATLLLCGWLCRPYFLFLGRLARTKFIVLVLLVLCIPFGAFYYTWDDIRLQSENVRFNTPITFSGVIQKVPIMKENTQEIIIRDAQQSHSFLLKVPLYPQFFYGDVVRGEGIIERPEPYNYAQYLLKERIIGIVVFPYNFERSASHNGSRIREILFNFRTQIIERFQKILPVEEAAFLSGLTLGVRSEFSKEFKDAMQKSGTTHMVALSGYNITILVWITMGIFLTFFSRRTAFIFSIIFIFAFVLMAGAEASVVRAAIMGILILLARETGRVYDIRNAVIFAGLIMVLVNPKVLVFDVGFQLSFLALLGIVYFRPVLMKIFHYKETSSLFSWKDNFITTTSAQIAVLPVLMMQFGSFSPFSVIANVIILGMIPITMALGGILACVAFLWNPLAIFIGWILWVFLTFETEMIRFFGKISMSIHIPFTLWIVIFYYVVLVGIIVMVKKRFSTFHV